MCEMPIPALSIPSFHALRGLTNLKFRSVLDKY